MQLIHAIIRGRNNMERYCEKRWHETPRWLETIGKIGEAKIYLRYWKSPSDENYYDYYVLIMQDPRGEYYPSHNELIKKCRELVEAGEARLLNA